MSKNIMNVEQNGHTYKIVPVEKTDGWYSVIKDGKNVKRIHHEELFIGEDIIDVEEWFKLA